MFVFRPRSRKTQRLYYLKYGKVPVQVWENRVCHQWKNKKIFRAFCARKALRTLRLTQCPQNWLTMMAGSANFEDRENFLTVVLLCCKSVCDPSAHIFTIISLFYSASTIGIEPELCFSKCCISDMAWPTYLPLCQ